MKSTVTLTFGDQAENHSGMQRIGQMADCGFNYDDLVAAKEKFEALGCECELVELSSSKYISQKYKVTPAYLLVIRNAVNKIIQDVANATDAFLAEQNGLVPVKKLLCMVE